MLGQSQDVLRMAQHMIHCVTKSGGLIIVKIGESVHNPALGVHNAEQSLQL
jgi:hypothetical protein